MKINRSNYQQFINQIYKKNTNNKYEKREMSGTSRDSIELSLSSKDIKAYIDTMKEIETGNKDKIETIKQKLSSGAYEVSSEELSRIILDKINRQISKGED